jgi:diguanylate cyclase (GGDEF)-like protein
MELKNYLRILLRRWRIFLPALAITLIATAILTLREPSVYQARTSFVVRLASFVRDDRSLVSGLETLSRRAEIATTFAEVGNSRLIRQQAGDILSLEPRQVRGLSVNARLIAGTNILEMSVQGTDRTLVAPFANAVGAVLISYTKNLYETYELETLDAAVEPNAPISPNRLLNLALGLLIGLVLASGLSFLAEYLQAPSAEASSLNILDPETGAYNRRYFMFRLRQEISRARRHDYPLSVALIDINHRGSLEGASLQVRREAMRRIVALLEPHLRDEDVMARFDDTVLALMLPDLSEAAAKEVVETLRARLGWAPLELDSATLNVHGAAGVVAFSGNGMGHDELMLQATRALEDAENDTHGRVRVFSELATQH